MSALHGRSVSETVSEIPPPLQQTLIPLPTVGGIIAAFSFLAKDAPKYIPGYSLCIAFICLSALANTIYFAGLVVENRKRDRGDVKGVDLPEGEKALMGDLSPDYRYML